MDRRPISAAPEGLEAIGNQWSEEMSELTSNTQDHEVLVLRYLDDPRPDLKDMIMIQYSGMVERIARRFSGLEAKEDLVQVGYIGLLNALNKFDPTAGVRFNTYATHLVAGEIKHYLRDRAQTIRQPAWLQELRHRVNKAANLLQGRLGRQVTAEEISIELGISVNSVEEVFATQDLLKLNSLDATGVNEDEGAADIDNLDAACYSPEQLTVEDRVVLERAIQQLRDLEREVLVLFHIESLNQTEIAHQLNISCNYVSHILRNSLNKLRKILSKEEANDRALRKQTEASEDVVLDELTGIYNESYFHGRLSEEVHRAKASGSTLAVIGIEFEGMDELLHMYGEVCVRDFLLDAAEHLTDCVRRLDIVCRSGVRGFAIILPGTGTSSDIVLERLIFKFESWLSNRRAPSGPIKVKSRMAICPEECGTAEEIVAKIMPGRSDDSAQKRAA